MLNYYYHYSYYFTLGLNFVVDKMVLRILLQYKSHKNPLASRTEGTILQERKLIFKEGKQGY